MDEAIICPFGKIKGKRGGWGIKKRRLQTKKAGIIKKSCCFSETKFASAKWGVLLCEDLGVFVISRMYFFVVSLSVRVI